MLMAMCLIEAMFFMKVHEDVHGTWPEEPRAIAGTCCLLTYRYYACSYPLALDEIELPIPTVRPCIKM